jgi:uncharacterized protein (TIGR03067 family)
MRDNGRKATRATVKAQTDLDTLQGTWHVVEVEVDGEHMPMSTPPDARIVVDGSHFTSLGMGAAYQGTLEVDQTKKPKSFDLIITAGHAAGTRNRGIYKLEGGRWTICLATRGTRRPVKFATRPGTGLALETLDRSSSRRPTTKTQPPPQRRRAGAPTATRSPHAAPSGPATPLEGEWTMVSGVFNGVQMSEPMVKWCTRVTRGSVTSVLAGPQIMLKASFTLDESKRPHAIDYVNLEGTHARKSQAGIVELTGDTLRICMAAPGKPRPADFSSKSRDGRSFTTWRRMNT